jgi:hypothetical protein
MTFKLNYKILGRRLIDTSMAAIGKNAASMGVHDAFAPLEAVDVEWTHTDGPFPQHKLMMERRVDPATGELVDIPVKINLPAIPVIKDQINVRVNSPDSLVMQMCEEKRERLAFSLGIEP